ncbi:MAG TPA: hypothetical protein ENK77_00555 [Epsilonproteobacteria bacterium]|nr:hypothetical protein [Campylobacterota bacterium]
MIEKKALLFSVIISALFASENPFSVEKNIHKIEEEESAFLKVLEKDRESVSAAEEKLAVQPAPEHNETIVVKAAENNASIIKAGAKQPVEKEKLLPVKESNLTETNESKSAGTPAADKDISPVEKVDTAVDTKIKVLEKNLNRVSKKESAAKKATDPERSSEFEKELREAIKSVQD